MQRVGSVPRLMELSGELVRVRLGGREHDRLPQPVVREAGLEQAVAVLEAVHVEHVLVDRGVGRARVLHLHPLRLAQQARGDVAHGARQRGGEAHGLALGVQRARDQQHVVGEAHVEHAVGLVEHQHFHAREVDPALVELVHQPPGRRHQHFVRRREQPVLQLIGLAAGDAHGGGALHPARERLRGLGHLLGEFARGREHQDARTATAAPFAAHDPGERGQHERCGLAGAGGRRGDQVAAGEQDRDRARLHRRGLGDAHAGQRRVEGGDDAEVGKSSGSHAESPVRTGGGLQNINADRQVSERTASTGESGIDDTGRTRPAR